MVYTIAMSALLVSMKSYFHMFTAVADWICLLKGKKHHLFWGITTGLAERLDMW